MPFISAVVEDEKGKPLGLAITFSQWILPRRDDVRFACLRFVDPYGDTVFNCLQFPVLLEELQLLLGETVDSEHRASIEGIEKLVKQCQSEPGLYLRLSGD